jgi:hypothetical protein
VDVDEDYHLQKQGPDDSPCKDAGFEESGNVSSAVGNEVTVTVTDKSLYSVGDVIEIDGDILPRIIVAVSSTSEEITFAPSVGAPTGAGTPVSIVNWLYVANFADTTTGNGPDNSTIVVDDVSLYRIGDTIKIGDPGVYAVVTDIGAGTISFTPAASSTDVGIPIHCWTLIEESDIDGEPRIMDGRIDMGADEYSLQESGIEASCDEVVWPDNVGVLSANYSGVAPATLEWYGSGVTFDPDPPMIGPGGTVEATFPGLGIYDFLVVARDARGIELGRDTLMVAVKSTDIQVDAGSYPEFSLSGGRVEVDLCGSVSGCVPAHFSGP